jgi:hypothetical protein
MQCQCLSVWKCVDCKNCLCGWMTILSLCLPWTCLCVCHMVYGRMVWLPVCRGKCVCHVVSHCELIVWCGCLCAELRGPLSPPSRKSPTLDQATQSSPDKGGHHHQQRPPLNAWNNHRGHHGHGADQHLMHQGPPGHPRQGGHPHPQQQYNQQHQRPHSGGQGHMQRGGRGGGPRGMSCLQSMLSSSHFSCCASMVSSFLGSCYVSLCVYVGYLCYLVSFVSCDMMLM